MQHHILYPTLVVSCCPHPCSLFHPCSLCCPHPNLLPPDPRTKKERRGKGEKSRTEELRAKTNPMNFVHGVRELENDSGPAMLMLPDGEVGFSRYSVWGSPCCVVGLPW